MAVVATIHQPSIKVFNCFTQLYLLSYHGLQLIWLTHVIYSTHVGKCIYDGAPQNLTQHLASHGTDVPRLYNPADFVLEVATGDHGEEILEQLSQTQQDVFDAEFEATKLSEVPTVPIATVVSSTIESWPLKKHLWIHVQRSLLIMIRDPIIFGFRFSST